MSGLRAELALAHMHALQADQRARNQAVALKDSFEQQLRAQKTAVKNSFEQQLRAQKKTVKELAAENKMLRRQVCTHFLLLCMLTVCRDLLMPILYHSCVRWFELTTYYVHLSLTDV